MTKDRWRKMDGPAPAGLDFHQVFAEAPTPFMVMDRGLKIVYANEAYLKTTMRTLSDIQGRYVFEAFPESQERMARFKLAFERALAGEQNVLTTEPFSVPAHEEEGGFKEMVWTCSHTPIANDAGEIEFVLQNAIDVTTEYRTDQHNAVLLRELDHRARNLLMTIQAITRQSMVDSKTMSEAREDFLARIHALSGVHNLLLDSNWDGARLGPVLECALEPFGYAAQTEKRIRMDGPCVPLNAKQAQTLSMAMHELATNAMKYGALSNDAGVVSITWSHTPAPDGAFELVWRERGGPPVQKPSQHGFGTTILTKLLTKELGGSVSLDYPVSGLVCRMEGRL